MKLIRFVVVFSAILLVSLFGCDNKKTSPDERLESSAKTVFKADWDTVQFGKHVDANKLDDGSIMIVSSGNNPTILFPSLPLKPDAHYILSVNLSSDVKAQSQVFYSTADTEKVSLSEDRSKWLSINNGENTLIYDFKGIEMGKRMRFDPLERSGTVQIHSFELREVN